MNRPIETIVRLLTIFLVYSLIVPIGNISSEISVTHECAQQNPETSTTFNESNKITQAHTSNYSIAKVSKSMIRVRTSENKSVNLVLGCQADLKLLTAGLSTIIIPPLEIRNKIDANLLNLTSLVTKAYIQNNQTNIIISISRKISPLKMMEPIIHGNLVCEIHKMYSGRHTLNMNFLVARVKYSALFELAKNPYINYIWLNRKFEACLDESVEIIKDPAEWTNIESLYNRKINGSKMKIAILDTGIDSNHPDFYFPNDTSKIIAAKSFTGESAEDRYGHGTHCASISAGTGAASTGQYVGVAPGAALLNVKVLDDTGKGLESWVVNGIQWAVDNGADILSMSFGSNIPSNGTDPLSMIVEWATEQGTACVVAAGNRGSQMYTITSPGVAESAITVGASSKTDAIASFSSRGPTFDYRIKPDIVAPGVNIVAARANGTTIGTQVSEYYTRASGTSMATPHVAGAAALLLDAHPYWKPNEVKAALANYAINIGPNVLEQGSGRLDVCRSTTASIIGNSSTSFGRVHLNDTYNQSIIFQNLANTTLQVILEAEIWLIENGNLYNISSLNVSALSFTSGTSGTVELQLDTNPDLPTGYFEGRITATFRDMSIRIPFFLCIISQLNVEITDEKGSKIMAAFVLINAETGQTKTCSECSRAQFVIPEGNYIIQAMNIYRWHPSGSLNTAISFLIHQKLSIGKDETEYLQLSLASAYKLNVLSTDTTDSPLHLVLKQLLTPYYHIAYSSESLGTFVHQLLYLTNISEYMTAPCYFGFMGFSQDGIHWAETGTLVSEVDTYFIGWDLSKFGLSTVPTALDYANSELATFNVENKLAKSSVTSTIWFNPIAGIWKSGLWNGFQTHPGITWKIHILPYQYKNPSSSSWAELEWSCIYTFSTYPCESPDYFVIDRHFDPISKGETFSYHAGKTPLLPQAIYDNASYYGSGLCVPYYPLLVEKNLFLAKSNTEAAKRVEVLKDGLLIYNKTKSWAQEPIKISNFLESHGYGVYSFIVKTETSLNYSSQNVAEYIINYTDSSTDVIPPSITKIDCTPCFTDNKYPVKIRLVDNHKLRNVSLLYSLDNGPWRYSTLSALGEGFYSTNITIPSSAQKISMKVEASDGSGNSIRFSSKPVAKRGYETHIDATLSENKISGKLTVIRGKLVQSLYLKVKSGGQVMHTLTDPEGNFEFTMPESMIFPVEIEMVNLGAYGRSIRVIDKPHDIVITNLTPSKTVVGQGYCTRISVTVENKGNFMETFNLTAYANQTRVERKEVTLINGSSKDIIFEWNTTGIPKGNYTIKAYAEPVPGETDTTDNTHTDGIVTVTIYCDVNGDGWVDMTDIGLACLAYGTEPGDEKWNQNCDVTDDLFIDMNDIGYMCLHYGEHVC